MASRDVWRTKFGRLLVLRVQVFVVILGSIAMLAGGDGASSVILGRRVFTLYRRNGRPVKRSNITSLWQ
ncbi:hypothetical protein KCP77_17625 [Salmonella enterica subsp. enterica]|nr:hypothetical protein KCP77_17625 [Salmonella enterica subsp. enterica]